ncbi:MAG: 50S ribosomal protein L32 [Candidatus Moranbacteria bacterium]|nr:50S ribosomal protein L32 [Candidatus Moranbacteria bacterium]
MALPKQRHTRHRRDRARKQYDVKLVTMKECPQCKAPVLPHRICKKCGTYKGREIKGVVKTAKTPKKK